MTAPRESQAGPLRVGLVFCLILVPLGFTLGTLTLLGPVRWVTGWARASGLGDTIETASVLLLIIALLGVTALGALLLAYRTLASPTFRQGSLFPGVVALSAALALWAWLTPSLMARGGETDVLVGSQFTFGPYPSDEDLERLSAEGYTHVISLLHPAVAPFEPMLLAEERNNIATVGLELVHAPMLPWIGQNTESLETIRRLAESGQGKYYVHCYLGRDRVGVVRRLVASVTGTSAAVSERHPLADKDHLERGPVHSIDDRIFVTPFPTDEELLAFFQNAATTQVVSLLDPEVGGDHRALEHERAALTSVGVPLLEIPLGLNADSAAVERVVDQVLALEGVTIVHAYRSDVGRGAAVVRAFERRVAGGAGDAPDS